MSDAGLIQPRLTSPIVAVLAQDKAGTSRVLRLEDGRVVAEGQATAPSGEAVTLYTVLSRPPEPRAAEPYSVQLEGGAVYAANE